ncbi:MAG TPA: YcxB family protein [Pyrinomonadaceae bacterium]|nr:YcxB family protein [Pyrinomonadaceae bacterium]
MSESVKLQVRQDVGDYVAAVRAFFLRDYGVFKTLMGTCLIGAYVFFWLLLMDVGLFVALVPALFIVSTFVSAFLFAGPRKRFLRDPTLGQPFEIEFSDEGILLGAADVAARMSWNYYSRVVETERVYVLIRGAMQMTVVPKKSFTSAAQEASFRRLLKRHLPSGGVKKLKDAGERPELEEYVPPQTPPDWR